MIVERPVHPDVRALLMSGRPFQYAHLIKFERPSRPDSQTGAVSTSAHRYTYLTDGSKDVPFDDLSKDHLGVSNGSQKYIANKVLNVTQVQEATEARANNFTITLDGNGIGAAITANVTITAVGDGIHWDIDFADTVNIKSSGFREGDKIRTTGLTVGDYNIVNFRADNIIRIKKLIDTVTTGTGSLTLTLHSEEIKSILLNKNDVDYASFINREVFVYRAYFEEGQLVGSSPVSGITGPILLFKGIISSVAFEEGDEGITVQWSLTSHWGDFAQVKGRVTSDEFHRALDANGVPQPASAIKPVYAYDKGFMHAETSINLLSTYYVKVEKQKVKAKSGFLGLGIGSKVKVKKYFVKEPRYSELDFQLQAKSIPLIYGVRNVNGIPIFADTLLDNSSIVYMALVLSEGEIGGIYDMYVNGKSLICANQADQDARSTQNSEGTIDVVCSGRADRGDILSGTVNVSTTETVDYYDESAYDGNAVSDILYYALYRTYEPYVAPVTFTTVIQGAGITQGKSIQLTYPQAITVDFFSGSENQAAASQLVSISQVGNFKVQHDYWTGGDTAEYWGPNHRLLDTAYVVVKVEIKEGETTIPDLEFIVRGKAINCYNYDYSYSHDDTVIAENPDNFKLGQTVQIRNAATGSLIQSGIQIIDKWSFYRPDGIKETRFRFSQTPNLGYDANGIPSLTRFYMDNGGQTWTMLTFNHEFHSGTVPAELSTPITTIEPGAGGGTTVTYPNYPEAPIGGTPLSPSPYYSIYEGSTQPYPNVVLYGSITTGVLETKINYSRMVEYQ
jgi:hypothetical protein